MSNQKKLKVNKKQYKNMYKLDQLLCSPEKCARKLEIVVRPQFLKAFNMIEKFNSKTHDTATDNKTFIPVGNKFHNYLKSFGDVVEYNFNDGVCCDPNTKECTVNITYANSASAKEAYDKCIDDFGTDININIASVTEQPANNLSIVKILTASEFGCIFKYLNLFELSILEQVCWRFFELVRKYFISLKNVDLSNFKPLRESAIKIICIKLAGQHLGSLKLDGHQTYINQPFMVLFKYMIKYYISVHTLELQNFEYFYFPAFFKIFSGVNSLKLIGQVTDNIGYYLQQAKSLTHLKIMDPMLIGYCLPALRNITSLDVSYCVWLKCDVLQECFRHNSTLIALNIVGCKSLLKCITNAIAQHLLNLRELYIDANLIDISSPLSETDLNVLHIHADKQQNTGKYIDNFLIKMSKHAVGLQELHVYDWSINYTAQNLLSSFHQLKKIVFSDSSKIDPNIFVNIAMKQVLNELSLINCPAMTNEHCIYLFKYCPNLYYMNFRFCPYITDSVINDAISIISKQKERTKTLTFTIHGTGTTTLTFNENKSTIRIIQ